MMRTGRARLRMAPGLSTIGGVVAGWIALGAAGCGPITTTNNVAKARVAIAAAEAASAEKYAVYEYVSAVEYLRKAREEEGFSDFQAAIDYAAMAQDFAEKAKNRAEADPNRAGAADPSTPTNLGSPVPVGTPSGSSL